MLNNNRLNYENRKIYVCEEEPVINSKSLQMDERLEDILDSYTKAHPDSQRFYELILELIELHDRKQADYGRDKDPFANVRGANMWGVKPSLGAMIRMGDKFGRLQSFAQKGKLENESLEDSLRDIAVYAIITLVLLERGE